MYFNAPASRRSRGTRGGQFSHSQGRPYGKKEPSTAQLMKDLGSKVDTIPAPSSEIGQSIPVSIENFEAIASYSWLDSKDSTILVPGSPPVWQDRTMPYTVPRDTGTVFVDQNASRLSSSPLLPLIVAVSHHAPSFSLSSVDFITDRNGLRKLWRWAVGDTDAGTFRIDVDLVGTKTVLMQRWETETTQQGGPGYEREFEKASTIPGIGCHGTTGHHRIVTYDLAGLKMLVRFKVDACLPSKASGASKEQKHDPLDDLTAGLEKLSVAKPSIPNATTKVAAFNGAFLSIITRGTLVPQSDLLELKTRSTVSVGRFEWDDAYPQLLLSQTPNMYVCVHLRGTFQEVRKRTLEQLETETVARKAQDGLRKLRKILGTIQDAVREEGEEGEGARLSLICKGGADMVVWERIGKKGCLPVKVLERFKK